MWEIVQRVPEKKFVRENSCARETKKVSFIKNLNSNSKSAYGLCSFRIEFYMESQTLRLIAVATMAYFKEDLI